MDIEDRLDAARKLVSAARDCEDGHKEDILDGIEGHLDRLEREYSQLPERRYLVVADDATGFQGIANVHVLEAESEQDAIAQARESSATYGNLSAYRIEELPEFGDDWAFYR